jgi:hypothetical protein
MERKYIESIIPGDFGETEESILDYLYQHPGHGTGTAQLVKALKPQPDNEPETGKQAFQEIQKAVEALILARVVRGKRRAALGDVYFDDLVLTPKGELAAIKARRRLKKVLIDPAHRPPRK